ncbi:eukaryotic translation initiation factor 4E type 3-like [Prorops nasuta]|uniref:eukaryotic translation initiation factor 4E type 3-like n=1 Tax=Prorops nasuta TaxID=863751 RepID=UPI0034CE5348
MAAIKFDSKDETSTELSKSPVFSKETFGAIKDHENTGLPLHTPWTFWLYRAMPGHTMEDYEKHLKMIYTVNTVQGFWAVFNNIPHVGEMQNRYSYHLMRHEKRPIWEFDGNQNGGTWRLRCHKRNTEKIWKEIILAAIGEQLSDCVEEGDEISGITVSIRDSEDMIQIWNSNAELASKATILKKVHQLLPDIHFLNEHYKPHQSHYAYNRH